MQDEEVKKLLERVRSCGREIKIVAATKTRTAEEINRLKDYGITAMGENRVQELLSKYDGLDMPEIHFIGALQTNKVKYIVDKVHMIQSVDRLELGKEIDRRCARINKIMDVLVEVNYGEEESKSGCNKSDCLALIDELSELPHVRVKGLMSVLPIGAPEEMYEGMHALFERAKKTCDGIEYLSMGMSDDYITALNHGANIIRPGTLIFGKRIYPNQGGING